jgi:hypothetical protein
VATDSSVELRGVLTIKGRSHPVTLTGQYGAIARDGEGHERIAFEAATTVDRRSSRGPELSFGYRAAVADGAHLRIVTPHTLGVEPRAVWIEAATAQGGVARQAVALGMARDATLQALARRRTVG